MKSCMEGYNATVFAYGQTVSTVVMLCLSNIIAVGL